jgi:hypothetical protein
MCYKESSGDPRSKYYWECVSRNTWVVADSLNHLVFTMPFLPSEGEETKLWLISRWKMLVFHFAHLWYRYPVPNDIREFWYRERPDILNYMQKAYKDLDIQFYLIILLKSWITKLTAKLSLIHDSVLVNNNNLRIIFQQKLSGNNLTQTRFTLVWILWMTMFIVFYYYAEKLF